VGFFSIGLASFGHYALGVWAWGVIVAFVRSGSGCEVVHKIDIKSPFCGAGSDEEVSSVDLAEAGYAQACSCNAEEEAGGGMQDTAAPLKGEVQQGKYSGAPATSSAASSSLANHKRKEHMSAHNDE
jgi:hypothetical protein